LPQLSPFGVNGLSKRGQTALYCAARQGHADTVMELLQFDQIDVDKPCPEHGGTPLHASGFNGYEEVTAMLLYRGANQFALNKAGVSARAEARHGALAPYSVVTDQTNHAALLQKYPFLKNIPKKTEKEKLSGSDKTKATKPKRIREKKIQIPAGPKPISPATNHVYVQDPDTGIHSLWKILTSGTSKIFLYFVSNYSHRKTLDNLVLVNSLIRSLGYIVIIIGSGTLETSAVYFKDYATLFPHQYQDPSHASFEVMGFKKSGTTGNQLGGFTLITRDTKTPQILYEQRESSSESLSLAEVLSAAGASPEQIGGMTFLDENLKKKPSRESEIRHPGALAMSDPEAADPNNSSGGSSSSGGVQTVVAGAGDKVASGLKKTRKSLSFHKQTGKINTTGGDRATLTKSPSAGSDTLSPSQSFEDLRSPTSTGGSGNHDRSEPNSPRKPLSPRTSVTDNSGVVPPSKARPNSTKPLPQPVPNQRLSATLKLDSVKPLPQPRKPNLPGLSGETDSETSLGILPEDVVSPLQSPKTPGALNSSEAALDSPGGTHPQGIRKSLSRPTLFRNMSQPSRSSVSSLQRSQIENQPKEF